MNREEKKITISTHFSINHKKTNIRKKPSKFEMRVPHFVGDGCHNLHETAARCSDHPRGVSDRLWGIIFLGTWNVSCVGCFRSGICARILSCVCWLPQHSALHCLSIDLRSWFASIYLKWKDRREQIRKNNAKTRSHRGHAKAVMSVAYQVLLYCASWNSEAESRRFGGQVREKS